MNTVFFLALLSGGYLFITSLVWAFQADIIFYPLSDIKSTPADIGLDFEEIRLKTADGVILHGWFIPGPEGEDSPAALYFHGNAGNISHQLKMIDVIHDLGLACLIVDYRGYGRSGGRPSEMGLYRDGRAAWAWLSYNKGLRPEEIVVWGRSLGGAVAVRLASEISPGTLIVESCFTSLNELGRKLSLFLPVELISRFRFPVENDLEEVDCPVLIVHSKDDEVVPFVLGRCLFEAAGNPKEFLEIAGGHNEGFVVSKRKYVQGVLDFLKSNFYPVPLKSIPIPPSEKVSGYAKRK